MGLVVDAEAAEARAGSGSFDRVGLWNLIDVAVGVGVRGILSQICRPSRIHFSPFRQQRGSDAAVCACFLETRALPFPQSLFSLPLPALPKIPLPVQGEGKCAWRARVRAVATLPFNRPLRSPCARRRLL